MNEGTTTAAPTSQGLNTGRPTAAGVSVTLLVSFSAADQRPPDKNWCAHLDHASPATGQRRLVPGCLALVPGFGL